MKVSIITAAYNSAATIADTIESVRAQDYPDIEHIIVDGGSTDGTMDIVRRYAGGAGVPSCVTGGGGFLAADTENSREIGLGGKKAAAPGHAGETPAPPVLRYVSEPDHGIYDAMNKGIRMATGEVVGLLNSDDFFAAPDAVSALVRRLQETEADAVYGDVRYVDPRDLSRTVRLYSSAGFRRWKMRLGYMPAHPTFYCKKACYLRHGLFDTSFRVAADFEQLLRMIYVGRIRLAYVPRVCVTMRTGGASSSGLASQRAILADHLRAYRKNGLSAFALTDPLRYAAKVWELVKGRVQR